MMGAQAGAAAVTQLLPPASRAAGASSGSWVDVRSREGALLITCCTGALTGTVTYQAQTASDGSGTGAADIGGALAGEQNADGKIVIPADQVLGWIRVTATVVTGPALCAASLAAHPKYA